MKKNKLLVISNIISPYRVALFNEINKYQEIELMVAYIAESEVNRSWNVDRSSIKFNYLILPSLHLPISYEKTLHLSFKITTLFGSFKPDLIFLGTDLLGSSISWCVLGLTFIKKIPLIRYEAQHHYAIKKNRFKKIIYSKIFNRFQRFFVYSILCQEYLQLEYQIDADKIDIGYNVGDSKLFVKKVIAYQKSTKYQSIRSKYPEVMLLFVGALNDWKNILGLLNALKLMDKNINCDMGMFIAGSGPKASEVKQISRTFKHIKIYRLGFLQSDKLIQYFAISDIFVAPTLRDMASIVVSEALHSGLFTIASERDGSAKNFIIEGYNGFIINPYNVEEIIQSINSAKDICVTKKENLKNQIRLSVKQFTIEKYAKRLIDCVLKTVSGTK